MTAQLSTYAALELDREFRTAKAATECSTQELQIARALMDLGIIDARPANVARALSAAARLEAGYLSASLIRRNYGVGGLTYDLVNEAVAAAA